MLQFKNKISLFKNFNFKFILFNLNYNIFKNIKYFVIKIIIVCSNES